MHNRRRRIGPTGQFEKLENRELMAGDLATFSQDGRQLLVAGTAQADEFRIQPLTENGVARLEISVSTGDMAQRQVVDRLAVDHLVVHGLAGDDWLENHTNFPLQFLGGDGADTVYDAFSQTVFSDLDPQDQRIDYQAALDTARNLPRSLNLTAEPALASIKRLATGEIIAYELQNRGILTLNVMQHTYYADVDLGWGIKLDTTKLQDLLKGNATLPQIDPIKAISYPVDRTAESNDYQEVRARFIGQFEGGANEVFVASERFTNWASPQKLLELGAKAFLGAGEAVANEVAAIMKLEFWDMAAWAQRKWGNGLTGLDGFLLGLDGLSRHLHRSVYWLPVTYQEAGLPVSHRALAIRATDGELGSLSVQDRYFSQPFDWESILQDVGGGTASGNLLQKKLDDLWAVFRNLIDGELKLPDSVKNNLLSAVVDTTIYNALLQGTGLSFASVQDAQRDSEPFVDLRGSQIEKNLTKLLNPLVQGNQRSLTIDVLEFNTSNYSLTAKFNLHHKHSWGSLSEMADHLFVGLKHGIDELVSVVHQVSGDIGQTAQALWESAVMVGKTPLDLAKFMLSKGATAVDIADTFHDRIHFNWRDTAEALWKSGAMAGKYPLDLAKVLVREGANAADIADAFFDRLKFGWRDIAESVWKSGAMAGKYPLDLAKTLVREGANAADIADAFFDRLKFGWRDIAESLWKSGAMAGKYPLDLAKVLVREGANAADIADAFDDRLGFGWTAIANALWYSGAMAGKYAADLAQVLRNEGAGFDDAVYALMSVVRLSYWDAYWIVKGL
jgi:hypothetical protein